MNKINSENQKSKYNYYFHNGIWARNIIEQVMDYYDSLIPAKDIGYIWQILKYLLRFPFKGNRNSDLDKIIEYIKMLKEDE